MRLVVRLFAGLAERAGAREIELDELPAGLTLGELKAEIEKRRPEIGTLAHVAGVVGTSFVKDDRVLGERDEVSLLPPVSGGSGEVEDDTDAALERGVFELCGDALDPEALRRRVAHPSCGAITVFVGTTRDTNRDQRVVRLEYEAFEAMTAPEMARIFERCRATLIPASEGATAAAGSADREPSSARAASPRRTRASAPIVRMLCAHRIGTVEVGEPSVVIAVASAHRDAAFGACRFLIDELKKTLPIWKKEIYADGHHWIGDRS